MDGRDCIEIQDRAKDVIKSGGEWISSVTLENALMGHPTVAEAAVVAVEHPKQVVLIPCTTAYAVKSGAKIH